MIGPSSGAGGLAEHEVSDNQSRPGKKRIYDDLDIESFCEEVQTGRKRYHHYQEIEPPVEVVSSGEQMIDDTAALFPRPLSTRTDNGDVREVEECPVARLEVLLVDGTNSITWTTVSELESQHGLAEIAPSPSASSSSSSSKEACIQEVRIEETNYSIGGEYWETVATIAPGNVQDQNKTHVPYHNHNGSNNNNNNQQQQQQQQQQFDDQETGNLSWLLDFKLDPFIEAADEKCGAPSPRDIHNGLKNRVNGRAYGTTCTSEIKKGYTENGAQQQESGQVFSNLDNRNFAASRYTGPKKPPFTYTELIEHALRERGELTVSAIYQWISEHFPYYKSNDDRWKNSVRHNLSINPHFRKGSKAPHGAGHLWAIANRSGETRPRQTFNAATVNATLKQVARNSVEQENNPRKTISQMNPIDEVEAATASIMQQSTDEEADNLVDSVTLEHCAEEILSGIKKEVEVQYLVPMMVSNNEHESNQSNQQQAQELHYPVKDSDFLNPVSKEVVAEECGLISEGYLVTDLNPTTLGLNMVEPEIITPENLFGEELSFQFYELSSPSQIQSA